LPGTTPKFPRAEIFEVTGGLPLPLQSHNHHGWRLVRQRPNHTRQPSV